MKLIIDIPKEFETDYNGDKFNDFFSRVLCDIEKGVLCGNYEKETAEMFLKSFDESVPMANIVEKLEELKNEDVCMETSYTECREKYKNNSKKDCYEPIQKLVLDKAINIVKQEINNGLE